MFADEWRKFIIDWSRRISDQRLDDDQQYLRTCDPIYGYGRSGAGEEQVKAAESRLATKLPFSYREFLKATNGLMQPVYKMSTTGGDFWSAEEIDWLRVKDKSWIDEWQDDDCEVPDDEYFVYGDEQDSCNIRSDYLNSLLAISHEGDAGIYLLNPEVKDNSGEWEAWHLTSWMPGAQRFTSFEEMMRYSYMQLVKNRDDEIAFGF